MMNEHHEKWHWACCGGPLSAKLLWFLGLLSFLGGVLALYQDGQFWSVSVQTWYWTALVAGVLAIGAKSKRHGCNNCHHDEEVKK